jgi:ATP phosphoribosyltransferase
MIRIGLPKGRMVAESYRFCAALGVEIKPGVLSYKVTVGDLRVAIYLIKPQDVARQLAANVLDLGLTGDEWLMEAGIPPARRCLETRSYEATLSLLMAAGDARPSHRAQLVATPYPNLARRLLSGVAPGSQILAVSGSSEAFVPDIADACIDVVETGNSAALNALVVRASFGHVTTHLVRSEKCTSSVAAPIVELLSHALDRV